jgi:hypothetical protein
MGRRRALLVSSFLGGLLLIGFAVHRWPSDRGDDTWFSTGRPLSDRILGAADYVGGTLCFAAGPFFYSLGAPSGHRLRHLLWDFSREGRWQGGSVVTTLIVVSLFAAVFMGVMAIGALLSLFR